jgi:hypothetical protein
MAIRHTSPLHEVKLNERISKKYHHNQGKK